MKNSFNVKAVVISKPSKVMDKNNGTGKYVIVNFNTYLDNGDIEEIAPGVPMIIGAMVTTLNKDGVVKEIPAIGEECYLYGEFVGEELYFSYAKSLKGPTKEEILAHYRKKYAKPTMEGQEL